MDFSKITDIGRRILEQRKVEAAKKDLLGENGKLGLILKNIGEPICSQSSGNHFSNPFFDLDGFYGEDNQLPTLDEDEMVYIEGYSYYGLGNGVDIQIKYLSETQTLSVHYKSIKVFEEIENQLTCYVPDDTWELEVNRLYKRALAKEKVIRKDMMEEKKKEKTGLKIKMLDWLKNSWGINIE